MFHALEENVYSAVLGWNVLIYLKTIYSNLSFNMAVSLFTSCLNDLSVDVRAC